MNKILMLVFFCGVVHSSYASQNETRSLEIYSITEFVDGYIIKAIDRAKNDTLSIMSKKQTNYDHRHYKKIIVGATYLFVLENIAKGMAAMPPNSLIIMMTKKTVAWKPGDGAFPFYAVNTKGLWIKKIR